MTAALHALAPASTGTLPRRIPLPPLDPPYDDEIPAAGVWTPATDGALALVLPLEPPAADGGRPRLTLVEPIDPLDDDVLARATPRDELPDPRRAAAILVRGLLEVLAGARPLHQLTAWLTPAVLSDLEAMTPGRRPRAYGARLVRLRVSEPVPGVAEVNAVVRGARRCRALAVRLEGLDGRWQASALLLA